MPTIVNESPRSTPKTFQNGESSIQVEKLSGRFPLKENFLWKSK